MVSRVAPPLIARLIAILAALVLLVGCAMVPGIPRLELAAAPSLAPTTDGSTAADGTVPPSDASTGSDGQEGSASEPSGAPRSSTSASDGSALGDVEVRPKPRKGRFQMDLFRSDDFVAQYHASWCVGASMQMMANMMEGRRTDRSRRTQKQMYDLAREVSPWVESRPGASTYGWAGGLEELGYGPFMEMSHRDRAEALRIAARQMRYTRKPVGLLVWRGRHAWVMSGFKATADPAYTDDFEVTAVWVEDPWSGRESPSWGPGLRPHTLLTVKQLSSDFVRWASHHRPEYGRRGHFVIIAPQLESQDLLGADEVLDPAA